MTPARDHAVTSGVTAWYARPSEVTMAKEHVHQLCAGGGCCPVLVERPDGVAIEDEGKTLVELSAEQADNLARVLTSLGYGKAEGR